MKACQINKPANDLLPALLIGLHRKAETTPTVQHRVSHKPRNQVHRQFQPVGLFRVDGEVEIMGAGHPSKVEHAGQQFAHHPLFLHRLITRMQRRKLDGDARPVRQGAGPGCLADGLDGSGIGAEVAFRIGLCARTFPQHVIGETVALRLQHLGPLQRILDGFAQHELMAKQAHGLPRCRAHSRHANPAHEAGEDAVRRIARMQQPRGDAQRPG